MSVENPDKQKPAETNKENTPEKREPDPAAEKTKEETALEDACKTYLQAERTAASTNVQNDIEFKQSSIPPSLGYLPTLEALLKEVEDKDDWLTDSTDETTKEQTLLQNASVMVRNNLQQLSTQLEQAPVKKGPAYEKLRTLYVQRSARLTELVSCIDETFENTEIRDGQMAARQAMDTIKRMTTDEAIDWVERTMSAIDGNNWQSNGLKETYGLFANACKQGLRLKLAEEKQRVGADPKAAAAYVKKCMGVSELFTDRGSPIDGNLCDMEFAADMARQAMGFEELAMQYAANTLKKPNPLSEEINAKRGPILEKLNTLPPETQNDPQVARLRSQISTEPITIQGYAQQYAIMRTLERMFTGDQGAFDVGAEVESKLTPVVENAVAEFEAFLNGSWGGASSLEQINAAVGGSGLNAEQIEAWKLLSDIQGYGYDIGDKTWSYIGVGAKIAGMIAAGIAVGIATGGLGVIAGALSGGATMTVTGAVINQQGFDNLTDATNVYGKDMAINTATMGVSRYLTAGRMAFQASRTGAASSQSIKEMFIIAGQRGGMRALGEIDDAANIGTRILGATLEGTADTLISTTLDTTIQGGTFLENLQNNAMFMGLGYGEFAGPLMRQIRGLPNEELHGLAQMVNKAGLQQEQLRSLCNEIGVDAKAVFNAEDVTALLKNASDDQKKAITDACTELKNTRSEFEKTLNDIANKPESAGNMDTTENLDDAERMPESAESTGDVKSAENLDDAERMPESAESTGDVKSAENLDDAERMPESAESTGDVKSADNPETAKPRSKTLEKLKTIPDATFRIDANESMISVNIGTPDGRASASVICKRMEGSSLMVVESSKATGGCGPIAYDLVMEIATKMGCSLIPARKSLSDEAYQVWKFYYTNRPDVTKTELSPGDWYMGRHTDEYFENMTEDPSTWPPKTDPVWALLSGFQKQPEIIPILEAEGRLNSQ